MGDSSSATFFRSRSVDQMEYKVGAILAQQPPPQPLSAVVFHYNHGTGVRHGIADKAGAAFLNRRQHVILGLHGGTTPGHVEAQDFADAATWVTQLEEAIDQNGLCLQGGGFPSFFPPDQVDVERFFGKRGAARLRCLKARLDPDDVFCQELPGLRAA